MISGLVPQMNEGWILSKTSENTMTCLEIKYQLLLDTSLGAV